MLSDNIKSSIVSVVDFCAGPQISGAASGGSQNGGRSFEYRVNTLLSKFEQEVLSHLPNIKTGQKKNFNLYGHQRRFDHGSWLVCSRAGAQDTAYLFEAKSSKPQANGIDIDGNAHERVESQFQRAADIAEADVQTNYVLVICFNNVFERYGLRWLEEFRAHADRTIRGCLGSLEIVFLKNQDNYEKFFEKFNG